MPTRNINLTDRLDAFVEDQVASGAYGSASEVIRDAIRLLEERGKEHRAKLRALRDAAKIGFDQLDQGLGIVINGEKELDAYLNDVANRARRKVRKKMSDA